jgi:hypothetical protein
MQGTSMLIPFSGLIEFSLCLLALLERVLGSGNLGLLNASTFELTDIPFKLKGDLGCNWSYSLSA